MTHFENGKAVMVDVSAKTDTAREATARSSVTLPPEVLAALRAGPEKGDPVAVAELAGIMAAKRTSELIPLCHPLPLTKVSVRGELDERAAQVHFTATCRVTGKTGVEMEALTAASVAALTLYDMLKAHGKGMVIEQVRLLSKTGGKSGAWRADVGQGDVGQGEVGQEDVGQGEVGQEDVGQGEVGQEDVGQGDVA